MPPLSLVGTLVFNESDNKDDFFRIVDYAELPVIDLAEARTESGRTALAAQVVDAMQEYGFFYVINHGYDAQQASRRD
jgi:hypothetical protein